MITSDELAAFREAAARHGFDPDSFEIIEYPDPPGEHDVEPVRGSITIARPSIGVAHTYPAGHLSAWPYDFGRDLREGEYGEP